MKKMKAFAAYHCSFVLAVVALQNTGCLADEIPLIGKHVWQSSNIYSTSGGPEKAIDGNVDQLWNEKSCTHTKSDMGAWWTVDIGESVCVGRVVIYNRIDDCCKQRLSGALVRLGNENTEGEAPTNPVCGEIDVVDGCDVYELECNTEGRYLSVNLPGENYLTLCEVQIYTGTCDEACPEGPCSSDPCLNGGECFYNNEAYICNCQGTGFTGDRCQSTAPVAPCSSNPCLNDGQCFNSNDNQAYYCNCQGTGSSGERCQRTCKDELGMQNGDIPNKNIVASSKRDPNWPAYNARLNIPNIAWSPGVDDSEPWIQADIGYQTDVSGVITQDYSGNYVNTFKVSTFLKINGVELFVKTASGEAKVFEVSSTGMVTSYFPDFVSARIVRITCLTSNTGWFVMKFEILGCKSA